MGTAEASAAAPTILLAETDASLRHWLGALLREAGYRVLEAGDGSEVIRHLAGREAIQLVLTDARVGSMPGGEVARETSYRRPGVPVLRLIRTMAEGLPVCRADLDPSVLIWKPFTLPQLLEVIRDQLARSAAAEQGHAPSYTFLR
jgi:DNA-binding response OmpR family regulator